MLLYAELVPAWLNLILAPLMVLGCGVSLRFADWRALTAVPARLNLLFGGVVFCLCLWLMGVEVGDTLRVHLLGITSLTLVLGGCFAVLSGTTALLLYTLIIGETAGAVPMAWLLTVLIPAAVSRLLIARLSRIPARNLFIYTLGGGFGGGVLSFLTVALVALPLLWLAGQSVLVQQALQGWPFIVLVLFPEGFINGMLVTAVCVFFPGAVKTFDDQFYFEEE